MKKNFSALCILIFFVGFSCQKKIEKEKAAIIAVIEEETNAWYDRDYERLIACHVLGKRNIRLTASKGRFFYTVGFQNAELKKFIANDPDLDLSKEVKSNFKINVYPKSAWAVYDNAYYDEGGELVNTGVHVQFLEKHEGKWKIVFLSMVSTGSYVDAENNLKIANMYHDTNPDDVDMILTEEFIGRNEEYGNTWDIESARNFLNNHPEIKDTVYNQIGEGDLVATEFTRTMNLQGKDVKIDVMHFKRFENGKIAEIMEYSDTKEVD